MVNKFTKANPYDNKNCRECPVEQFCMEDCSKLKSKWIEKIMYQCENCGELKSEKYNYCSKCIAEMQ